MIDGTDLISLETEVRSHIGEETAKFWTQARVFKAINAEVMRLCRHIAALDNGWLEQTYTPSTVAATVTLPVNCYIVRTVELYINGAWMNPRWGNDHQRGQYQQTGTTYPDFVQFAGNTLTIDSGVSDASSLRVRYARLPASMRYEAATAGAAATITFASTASVLDDVYNDDRIVILSGTSAGDVRTISDYVGSTKVATVSANWTSTPDTTSYFSTLLPEPLAKYPDVVALGAALRLLPRRRDDNLTGLLANIYERDLREMLNDLSQRQTQQASHGNYLPQGDE